MSNETDVFPVTNADGDFGTTLRLYYFQGATEAAAGDDASTNAADLEEADAPPTDYGLDGYGIEVKSDGDDQGIFVDQGIAEHMQEVAASINQLSTSECSIEAIFKFDDWLSDSDNFQFVAATSQQPTASNGFQLYLSDKTTGHRILFGTSTSNRIFATISPAAFSPANGDWVYLCATYDTSETGDDQVQLYMGNLTSITADVIAKTATGSNGAGDLNNPNVKMKVGASGPDATVLDGLTKCLMRTQDKAFTLAIIEAQYELVKAYSPAAGGVGNLINGGLINTGLVGGRLV